MDRADSERRHLEIALSGLRAHATAVGLVTLLRELRQAGTLDDAAVNRVRDAIIDDLSLSRPMRAEESEFRERLRTRLDRLIRGTADPAGGRSG